MIKRDRLGMKTTWMEESHQGDGSRVLREKIVQVWSQRRESMTVYSDNFVDDYHICGLIVYMAYN